jgi:hypothetical protein
MLRKNWNNQKTNILCFFYFIFEADVHDKLVQLLNKDDLSKKVLINPCIHKLEPKIEKFNSNNAMDFITDLEATPPPMFLSPKRFVTEKKKVFLIHHKLYKLLNQKLFRFIL